MNNYPQDRHYIEVNEDGQRVTRTIHGESLADTADRIERIISQPPPPPPRLVPMELRDPDAPEGWYDEPDMSAAWSAFAARQGVTVD